MGEECIGVWAQIIEKIKSENYDNVGECQYAIPSHWDMGKVYKRFFTDMQWKLIKFSAIIEQLTGI